MREMMMGSVIMDRHTQPTAEQSEEAGDQGQKSNDPTEGGTSAPERCEKGNQPKSNDGSDSEKPRSQFFEDRSDCSKRLFGTLVKRLKMFKQESELKSDVEKRRRETEERLVEKLNKDKEELMERAKKRREDEEKQVQAQRQENEKFLAEKATNYKNRYKQSLSNYLITKEKPPIMYKPAIMLPIHKELLEEHRALINTFGDTDHDCISKHDSQGNVVKSLQKTQESLNIDDHGRSVDMELDEEEWLLSKVPEVICDRQQNSDLDQTSLVGNQSVE